MGLVKQVSSLTGNGLQDWILQRLSAVVMTAYVFLLFGFYIFHPGVMYSEWHALFALLWFKVFTFVVFLLFIAHAWVGIWTVLTDYVHCALIRSTIQYTLVVLYGCALVWLAVILWR